MTADRAFPDPEAEPATVGIRELRHDFRAFVERVRRGERLVVTDRGQPIAELVPHRPKRSLLQQMIDDGRVIPARHPLRVGFRDDDPVTTDVSDALREMRDEDGNR